MRQRLNEPDDVVRAAFTKAGADRPSLGRLISWQVPLTVRTMDTTAALFRALEGEKHRTMALVLLEVCRLDGMMGRN